MIDHSLDVSTKEYQKLLGRGGLVFSPGPWRSRFFSQSGRLVLIALNLPQGSLAHSQG